MPSEKRMEPEVKAVEVLVPPREIGRTPDQPEVKVWVVPDEPIVRVILESDEVAKVWVAPVNPPKEVMPPEAAVSQEK